MPSDRPVPSEARSPSHLTPGHLSGSLFPSETANTTVDDIGDGIDGAATFDRASGKTQSKTPWQLLNMNAGFLGIQFAWGLQMANMSAIFEQLGADPHQLPLLWLAAPLTGLLIQPIIGEFSDRTWTPFGRRRPYLLAGAILASIALVLMPSCSSLGMAVVLLWLLDCSANISMVPFRAFVGDLLPPSQLTQGFAVQSLMVGLGAVLASGLPWLLSHGLHLSNQPRIGHQVSFSIELSFYLGAIAFLSTIVWTIATTPEHPPTSSTLDTSDSSDNTVTSTASGSASGSASESSSGSTSSSDSSPFSFVSSLLTALWHNLKDIQHVLRDMPATVGQLAAVQWFTWLGFFCFFLYFTPAIASNIFGTTKDNSMLYNQAMEWAGVCFAMFNIVCVVVSLMLPLLAKWSDRRTVHGLCLLIGGVSLVTIGLIHQPYWLLLNMVGFGIAWASALSMPYAMLSGAIPPHRQGIYQGIFNAFIVLPEVAISLGFGWVMQYWLHDNRLIAVVLGGGFLLIAALLTRWIDASVSSVSSSSQ